MENVNFIYNLTYMHEFEIKNYENKAKKLNLNFVYEEKKLTEDLYNSKSNKFPNDKIKSSVLNGHFQEDIEFEDLKEFLLEYSRKEKFEEFFIKTDLISNCIFFPIEARINSEENTFNKNNKVISQSSNFNYHQEINNENKDERQKNNKLIIDDNKKNFIGDLGSKFKNFDNLENFNYAESKEILLEKYSKDEYAKLKNNINYYQQSNNSKDYILENENIKIYEDPFSSSRNIFDKNFMNFKKINNYKDNYSNGVLEQFDFIIENNIFNLNHKNELFNFDLTDRLSNQNNQLTYQNLILDNTIKNYNNNKKFLKNSFVIYGPEKSGKSTFLRGENTFNKDGFMLGIIKNTYNILNNLLKDNKKQLIFKYGSMLITENDLITLTQLEQKKSYYDEIHIESFKNIGNPQYNLNINLLENVLNKKAFFKIKHVKNIEDIKSLIFESIKNRKCEIKKFNTKLKEIRDQDNDCVYDHITLYHFTFNIYKEKSVISITHGQNELNNNDKENLKNTRKNFKILNDNYNNETEMTIQYDFYEVNSNQFDKTENNTNKIKEKIENLFNRKALLNQYPVLERVLFKSKFDTDNIYFILNCFNYKNIKFNPNPCKKTEINGSRPIKTYNNFYIEEINNIKNFDYLKSLLNPLKLNRYFKRIFNRKDLLRDDIQALNVDDTCDECLKLKYEMTRSRKIYLIFEEEVNKIYKEMQNLEYSLQNLRKMKEDLLIRDDMEKYANYTEEEYEIKTNESFLDENKFLINSEARIPIKEKEKKQIELLTKKLKLNSLKLKKQLNTLNKMFLRTKQDSCQTKVICEFCKLKKF